MGLRLNAKNAVRYETVMVGINTDPKAPPEGNQAAISPPDKTTLRSNKLSPNRKIGSSSQKAVDS
jgi:hypothetical protein